MNKVQPSCPCGTSEEECPNADGDPLCAQPQADVLREAQADADDWKDDPSANECWNAGLDYGMVRFCKCLGVNPKSVNWDAATEELDGDVCAVIGNILRVKFGEDWDPTAAQPQTARMQEVSRIVRTLLTNDAFPEYRMDDDRGLEESEYVDFAMRVLSALSTSTACGYSEQPRTGAQPLYAAQLQADGVREALKAATLDIKTIHEKIGERGLLNQTASIQELCRRALDQIDAALASEGKPDVPQTPWMPIETIPEDRPIQAWHITWKCPVTIQKRSWGDRSAWVEKTLTTEWPLAAFSHWMEVAASPLTRPDRTLPRLSGPERGPIEPNTCGRSGGACQCSSIEECWRAPHSL